MNRDLMWHFKWIGFLILSISIPLNSFAITLEVGPGRPYASPSAAALDAQPGDTVLIFPATYTGSNFISNLHGLEGQYIYFIGVDVELVVFQGGSQGLHFSQVSFIHIEGISITGHTANGINIDDGGTIDSPSHHIVVRNCRFYDMAGTGNNDFLKLSGIDFFEVTQCTFLNGAAAGSGIDMVGCHNGIIQQCAFQNLGSNCIQAKGGTQFVEIRQNWFENGGFRSLNLGGSTSLEFFRPIDAPFEAADLFIYANVFIGSTAPIAYVGCVNVDVVNNTIISPGNWVIRILQESVDPDRFLPCGDNSFVNNIVYYDDAIGTHVNIGSNTNPGSFTFGNNLWYRFSQPGNSAPNLPVSEQDAIIGLDPFFEDVQQNDFRLTIISPGIDAGQPTLGTVDFEGQVVPQGSGTDIGAFEFPVALSFELMNWKIQVVENHVVKLFWQTSVSEGAHTFALERSRDAKHWEFVKNIALNEGQWKDGRLNFEFEDKAPFTGISYYRLKYTTMDGVSGFSPILKAHLMKSESVGIHCFPNPFTDFLFLKNESEDRKELVLDVLNQYGIITEAHRFELESQEIHMLPTNHWLPGLYFLSLNEKVVIALVKK